MKNKRLYVIIPQWGLRDKKFDSNNFFLNQTLALKKNGYDPLVISIRPITIKSGEGILGYKIHNHYFANTVEIVIYDLYVPVPMILNTLREAYISHFYCEIIKKHLVIDKNENKMRPVLMHAHVSHECAYYCIHAAKKEKIPLVVTEHYSGLLTGTATVQDYIRVKKTIEGSSSFIFVGHNFQKSICKKLNISKKTYVIPNMVDESLFRIINRQENKDFTFLSAGTLKKNKSFDLVIRAFHNEFNVEEKVKLVLAGEGIERKFLEKLTYNLGETKRVIFLGEYQKSNVGEIFGNANAFVLTSKVETFGIVYVEAMLSGLPCIGTKGQGGDDIINDFNGYLCQYGNLEELSIAMRRIYENYNLYDREKIRNNAISAFSERNVVQELERIYQNLVKEDET